jgi:hypothetical protein
MQDPAAFFVAVGVQEDHVIFFDGSVDDGGEAGLFKGNDFFAGRIQAFGEGIRAVSVLQVT